MPREAVKQKPDDSQWYIDDDLWLDLLRPLIGDDDAQAERAARLFHRLAKEIEENGSDGHTGCDAVLRISGGSSFPSQNLPTSARTSSASPSIIRTP